MKSRLEGLVTEMVEEGIPFEDAVAEFERQFILLVLERTNGNLSKAADALRIHRGTLSKRVGTYRSSQMASRRRGSLNQKPALRPLTTFPPSAAKEALDGLAAEFDALLTRMQTTKSRKAMNAAFNASPAELGRAAVKAASKSRKTQIDRQSRTPSARSLREAGLRSERGSRKT